MIRVTIKPGEDRRIKGGHPWIFSNEILEVKGERTPGIAAEVFTAAGHFIGTGYYNPNSLIAVRLVSKQRVDIDSSDFYRKRIETALCLRRSLYPGLNSFRAVYSEGDFLPGLIVDKYGEYLSVQFLTQGIEKRREAILTALLDTYSPCAVIARNDAAGRKLEGLEQTVEVLHGKAPEIIEIEEHGLHLQVDIIGGQKTGHFLDQKDNHLLLKEICGGKSVLDCFSYSGSWGIHAALYGARSVTFVDVSTRALTLAKENAVRNSLGVTMHFAAEDAFDQLKRLSKEGTRFGVVVLDPPAFVKSRKTLKEAEKGYLTINRRAMELLDTEGYLITCSCSYHMGREMFRELLAKAAKLAGRQMRIVATRSQALDHPVILAVPETEYLKCFLLQAVQ